MGLEYPLCLGVSFLRLCPWIVVSFLAGESEGPTILDTSEACLSAPFTFNALVLLITWEKLSLPDGNICLRFSVTPIFLNGTVKYVTSDLAVICAPDANVRLVTLAELDAILPAVSLWVFPVLGISVKCLSFDSDFIVETTGLVVGVSLSASSEPSSSGSSSSSSRLLDTSVKIMTKSSYFTYLQNSLLLCYSVQFILHFFLGHLHKLYTNRRRKNG